MCVHSLIHLPVDASVRANCLLLVCCVIFCMHVWMNQKLHVLKEGENLVTTGDDFTAIFHVAQGRIEVKRTMCLLCAVVTHNINRKINSNRFYKKKKCIDIYIYILFF